MKLTLTYSPSSDPVTRQQRLRASATAYLEDLAHDPRSHAPIEVTILAQLCEEHFLVREAARLHRWLGEV